MIQKNNKSIKPYEKKRMNTLERIKKTAIKQFSEKGYNGTSMSSIADAVGIKKASIYAHISSKEELFQMCMKDAQEEIIHQIKKFLEENINKPYEDKLYLFLKKYGDINKNEGDEIFYIRFGYMPPEELSDKIINTTNIFIQEVEKIFSLIFEKMADENIIKKNIKQQSLDTYLCLFDGLMVELLFGSNKTYLKRLESSWTVFKESVFI